MNVNVELLSGLAMTRDCAEIVVVAVGLDDDGVVASRMGGDGGGDIAGPVVAVFHLHHIVKLLVVCEN